MDLDPFRRINPCGYAGLEVTQVADLGGPAQTSVVARDLEPRLLGRLTRAMDASCGTATPHGRAQKSSSEA
jgi:lipoyl(octanoyl) transferase